jgi:hypothetical protein
VTSIAEAYRAEGLLPYHELPDITQPDWCPDPLVVERDFGDGQRLLALGLAHHSSLESPHYRVLVDNTARFMGATVVRKRLILNEGGIWPRADTLEQAYQAGGEAQWTQNYGMQTETQVESPELDREGIPLLLEEGFTPAEIACHIFVRQVPQYWRLDWRMHRSFDFYIEQAMRDQAIRTGLNFDFQVSTLITLYEDTFGRKFDKRDTQFFYQHSVGYMLEPESRVQEVAIASNMARDLNFLRVVRSYLDKGMSVEWVCGWTHVRALQAKLESMQPRSPQLAETRE